jgi:hypothetical protein
MPRYATLPTLHKRKATIPLIGNDLTSSGGFTPATPAGLQAWYKDTGIVDDGSTVQQWSDSSGNGNHLLPIGTEPGISIDNLNHHNVVLFSTSDGSTGTPLHKGSALMSGSAATMVIVAYKDSNWGEGGWYTTRAIAQANHHPFSDNNVYDTFFSTARKSCGAQVVTISDNWRILIIRSQANDYRMQIGSTSQFTTATNTFALGSDFILGCGAYDGANQTYAFQGMVAEAVVYNAFVSDSNVANLVSYYQSRFLI